MSVEAELAVQAGGRHGVITRREALAMGMSSAMIRSRVESGRWRRVANGVYVIVGSVDTFEQRVAIACAASSGGVASHFTACRLHSLLHVHGDGRLHISARRGVSVRSGAATVHLPMDLDDDMVTTVSGLAVTTIERSLLDVGGLIGRGRLGRAVDAALDRKQTTWSALEACHRRHARRGRHGIVAMRVVLVARGDGRIVTESELERRYLAFCERYRLDVVATQVRLHWRAQLIGRVDVVYPDQRLVIELDGRLGHSQLTDFERDRVRDQQAAAAGWLVARVTWHQIMTGHEALHERLVAILAARSGV